MAISLLSCYVATTLCNGSTATTRSISPQNISKVVLGLNLLRFLTVTLVLTRVYLVLPFLFAALLLLTGFFTLAPSKSKVSWQSIGVLLVYWCRYNSFNLIMLTVPVEIVLIFLRLVLLYALTLLFCYICYIPVAIFDLIWRDNIRLPFYGNIQLWAARVWYIRYKIWLKVLILFAIKFALMARDV